MTQAPRLSLSTEILDIMKHKQVIPDMLSEILT